MKGIRYTLATMALAASGLSLGACVMPAGDYGGPGGYAGEGGYAQPAPQPEVYIVDVNGDWRFGSNVNRIRGTYDGMLVNHAVWRSNDKRNLVIHLYR